MKTFTRRTLLATSLVVFSFVVHASTSTTPAPTQDPVVQHLKLNDVQITKIKTLHQQLISNIEHVSAKEVQDGALLSMIQSGKWDDDAVKKQLSALSEVDQQIRYYKVKYYFDFSQTLTPEQRQLVQDDLARAATE